MKPRFQHDCTYCEYIGFIGECDIYICPQAGNPTIVARHSSKREDYFSGQRLVLGRLNLELNATAIKVF